MTLRRWDQLAEGQKVGIAFVIDDAQMQAFRALSRDDSLVHTDAGFARSRGYDGVIVYGGLMLAQLSHVLGMHLPGEAGVSASWQIDYHNPLYVGEEARIEAEIALASEATRSIRIRYRIVTSTRLIASGRAQSLVLG